MHLAETKRSDFVVVAFVYAPRVDHAQIRPPEPVIAADEARPARPTREATGVRARGTAELAGADQRSRLLEAIVDVVARTGYPQTKIGDVASHAGVSRATFYELFKNKEECFLAAHRELVQRLSTDTARAVAANKPTGAMGAVFTALVDFADREPLAFNFLTHEAMLAGPNARDERDQIGRAHV